MIKINKNVIKWVLELYFETPYSNTGCKLADFAARYNVSYPTMRKFLPLFFNFKRGYSGIFQLNCVILYKKEDLVLLIKVLKSFKDPRSIWNFLGLFLSRPTAVNLLLKHIEDLKLQNCFEDDFKFNN